MAHRSDAALAGLCPHFDALGWGTDSGRGSRQYASAYPSPGSKPTLAMEAISGRKMIDEIAADHAIKLRTQRTSRCDPIQVIEWKRQLLEQIIFNVFMRFGCWVFLVASATSVVMVLQVFDANIARKLLLRVDDADRKYCVCLNSITRKPVAPNRYAPGFDCARRIYLLYRPSRYKSSGNS